MWGCFFFFFFFKVVGPRLMWRLIERGFYLCYKAMTWEMCHLVLVVHWVMVGLDIFVRDIISWDSCSQMEVVLDYKTDP